MSKSSHIRVVLVCSGSNEWDDAGRLSGSADLPLSERGFSSAGALVASAQCGAPAEVWSGPEEASTSTARLIAESGGVRAREHPSLREVGLGLWEGMRWSDAEDRFGSVFRAWREDPFVVVPPGGESFGAARERLCNSLREILLRSKAGETDGVCVVLRPLAFELVRGWLADDPACPCARPESCHAAAEVFVVERAALKRAASGSGDPVRDAG